ncbi:polysaccharide biosynthesis/export family protein [Mangrovimonas futianensis]|uniref:polysaccharide biosynthesis/export family protein n=1 Tax=Mangrovimonas futianensis TaxID=2895523 RepID=UPI001E2E2D62|nr:polysaccharide biosynthesis/export family protein [Mangrovimonas futianensis]MCF1421379.1 polysaccharide biosynthesis/export family protein [Mangrovimonas futianensis]
MKNVCMLVGVVITLFFTSCIPHKDLVYLQNKEQAYGADTIPRITETQKPYRVQINDVLNIRVRGLDQEKLTIFNPVGEENLNADSDQRAYFDGFTVDLHGEIRIPLLGKMNVLGYTLEEIEGMIKEKLLTEHFKETAQIFVTVKLTGLRYTVNGEIGNPGTNTLFQERVNVFQAIANAGEIPMTGNKKDVLIIRQYPQGQQIHHIDLTDLKVMESPYYYIQPNDIIYVKPLKQVSWGFGTTGKDTFLTVFSIITVVSTTLLLIDRL